MTVQQEMHTTENPIILFDGVCNLCNHAVQVLLRRDKRQVFTFSSLQSNYAKLLLADSGLSTPVTDSVILYADGQIYIRSEAIIRIAVLLGGFYKLAAGFRMIPRRIRDALYDFIASHRYCWFGKRENCMIHDRGLSDRFLP